MANIEEIMSALQRLETDTETDADREILAKALREKVITIESGERSVTGGDIGNSVIVTGDGNIVHIIKAATAEALNSAAKPETIDPSGRWVTQELTNPFAGQDKFRLHFDLEVKGGIVLGAITQASTIERYSPFTKGIMDGKIEGNVVSFSVPEQSVSWDKGVQKETSYRNYYYGSVLRDQIEFTLQSDRPWGFPPQKFTAKRE